MRQFSRCDSCDETLSTLKLFLPEAPRHETLCAVRVAACPPESSAFVPTQTTDLEAIWRPGGTSSRKEATGPLTPFRARHGSLEGCCGKHHMCSYLCAWLPTGRTSHLTKSYKLRSAELVHPFADAGGTTMVHTRLNEEVGHILY